MSSNPSFQITFPAEALAARSSIRAIMAWLQDVGVEGELGGSIEIALAEAINNVVEHAFCGTEPGEIAVQADIIGTTANIVIGDDGKGLPDDQLPPGEPADVSGPTEHLPEGGFGWFLIRQLTSTLCYERREGHNRLMLGFDLKAAPPSAAT